MKEWGDDVWVINHGEFVVDDTSIAKLDPSKALLTLSVAVTERKSGNAQSFNSITTPSRDLMAFGNSNNWRWIYPENKTEQKQHIRQWRKWSDLFFFSNWLSWSQHSTGCDSEQKGVSNLARCTCDCNSDWFRFNWSNKIVVGLSHQLIEGNLSLWGMFD